MKKNWFIGLVLIAIMAFGVGCSDGSDVVQPPEEEPEKIETNLIVHGDFENMSSLMFGWGGINASIANGDGDGSYVVLSPVGGVKRIYSEQTRSISLAQAVFSLRKLN